MRLTVRPMTAQSLPSDSATTAPPVRPVAVLRQARVARGWNQGDLALAAGLTRSTISRLECGHEQPLEQTVRRLAEALDFPASKLFSDSEKGVSRPT